jgi:hypothetical protein
LFGERFAVDWLDAVKIDHANCRALRFQLVGGFQCFVQRDAAPTTVTLSCALCLGTLNPGSETSRPLNKELLS